MVRPSSALPFQPWLVENATMQPQGRSGGREDIFAVIWKEENQDRSISWFLKAWDEKRRAQKAKSFQYNEAFRVELGRHISCD